MFKEKVFVFKKKLKKMGLVVKPQKMGPEGLEPSTP